MDDDAPRTPQRPLNLRFGRFELREAEHQLLCAGVPVPLGGRAFDLLLALALRGGELVSRHALIEAVWPNRVVEENNLSVQINTLRKVLGPEWLLTVPGRGYRLLLEPRSAQGLPDLIDPPVPPIPPRAASGASADAPAAQPTHLPSGQPLLIGRSDDLAALGTLVEQHRLVTVVGAGGMGKTRLAQALLQLQAGRYSQGVCWVELGALADPESLPGAVAVALGIQSGTGPALQRLAQALAGSRLLLALDNAEHLLEAVARLAQTLLDAVPGLRLLVTSQAPLRLASERVYRLGPMALPQQALPAMEARAFAAVALFAERAAAADSRFVLTDDQVGAVIELCRQLDGVALAIELAAARAPGLGVQRLAASMSERMRVLTLNRNRFAPRRQQSLRAAIEWSHDLLSPAEQRLFRRLAVLQGSAPLERVQAVATDPPGGTAAAAPADALPSPAGAQVHAPAAREPLLDEWTLLDALDQLVQRSLVELAFDEEGGCPRYRLLESPRALARERLAAAGEEAAVRTRHAHAVRTDWDGAEAAMLAGELGVDDWRRDLALELDDARAALQWAGEGKDPGLTLGLASAMVARLPPALLEERQRLATLCQGLIEGVPDLAQRQRAWAAITVSGADHHAATQSLALARQLHAAGAPDGRYRLYAALCEAARVLPQEPGAAQAQRLLDEARTLEDPGWPAVRLRPAARTEASIAARRGQIAAAVALYRRLLALGLAAGDASLMTRVNLAELELQAGDARAAAQSCHALLAPLTAARDGPRLAFARLCLAAAHLAMDEPDAARGPLQQAWTALVPAGRAVYGSDYLALLAALDRRYDDAALLAGAADALWTGSGRLRQTNETRARQRCRAIATAALGHERTEALAAQGALLAPPHLGALAFPVSDPSASQL